MNKLKSLVAVFALALAASNVGCVVQGQDAEAPVENVAAQGQAIEFGDVMAGIDGAVQLGTMLSDIAEYGTPVTEGMIYGELLKTQKDIAALRQAVDGIQQELGAQDQQMLALAALGSVSNTSSVFDGYWQLKDKPDQQQQLLAGIRASGQSGFGDITWATLDQLDALVVGNGEVQSALQILSDHTTRSFDTMKQDKIGRFMADRRLIQEKAFFVMSRAYADSPDVVKAQRAKLDDRLAKQDAAFIAATRAYNDATYAQEKQNALAKLQSDLLGKAPGQFDLEAMMDAMIADLASRNTKALASERVYNTTNLAGSYRTPDNSVVKLTVKSVGVLDFVGGQTFELDPNDPTRMVRKASWGEETWSIQYDSNAKNVVTITMPAGAWYTRI